MPVERCPKCGKVISTRFPYHKCEPLTKGEFENLIDKACDSRTPKPDSTKAETSVSQTSDGCNDSNTHPDNLANI